MGEVGPSVRRHWGQSDRAESAVPAVGFDRADPDPTVVAADGDNLVRFQCTESQRLDQSVVSS
mgnify:FL=1